MPLTPNLGLNRPAHGDYLNTWDQPVNDNWDKIDDLFSGFRWDGSPSGPGHTHDGTAGRGPKIRHTDLLDIGTKTHADLDANFGKTLVSGTDTPPGYLEDKIVAGANVVITKLGAPGNETLEVAVPSVVPTLGDVNDPSGEYGWKHFVPTSAPVAYTDNFNYQSGFTLRQANYAVSRSSLGGVALPDFISTGYSAAIFVDPSAGDDVVGKYAATVACQIPHGVAQRVTLSITEFNYNDMVPGDFAAFTLSLFSTHRLGTALPQKYGVLLEMHLVCLGAGVFQMTHRIFVLPDTSTQVLLFQCQNHIGNPDDIKGAWELSLDSNGHVYHYWRRKLVYSSQSTPPNVPGPVQAYISTLMASLAADGDEKYGAMGFGFHYGISDYSKFNMEFRWFTATSNSDVYDEVPPACPGHIPDTYGIVPLVDLPKDFFIVPGLNPGDSCCVAPSAISVGQILVSGADGDPLVWVTGCNEIPAPPDVDPNEKIKGYSTNLSAQGYLPCMSPFQREPLKIYDLTGDWGYEGTEGKIVVHGIFPIPPLFELTPSISGFHVIGASWLDYDEFEIKYWLEDGTGGSSISLTITNAVDPARTFTFVLLDPVLDRAPEIDSISWVDTYTYALPATIGYQCRAQITGRGFDPATTFSTTTPGVSIVPGTTVIHSATSASVDVKFDFVTMTNGAPAAGAAFDIIATNGAGSGTYNGVAAHPAPLVTYVTVDPTPGGMDIDISSDKTAYINGNFFDVHGNLTVAATDPTILVGPGAVTIVSVSQTTIQIKYRIKGGVTNFLEFLITNTISGLSVLAPVGVVGDATPPVISAVSMLAPNASEIPPVPPNPTYNGCLTLDDRPLGPNGTIPPWEFDVFITSGMTPPQSAVYVFLTGTAGPLHPNSGFDSYTLTRGALGANGKCWTPKGTLGPIPVVALKPGIGSAVWPSIGSGPNMADPVPVVILSAAFSGGLAPGASGTATFKFASGLISYLSNIISVSDPGVAFDLTTRTVVAPDSISYDYAIAPTVVPATPVTVRFNNGPADAAVGTYALIIEYPAPVITAAELNLYQDIPANPVTLRGTGFRSGASVAVSGNASLVLGSVVVVSDKEITLEINNGSPGAVNFQVTNTDAKSSNLFTVTLLTELAADVDHVDGVEGTGLATTLYIYGDNLTPPGAAYSYTGFTPSGPPTVINDSYIEQPGTITAPAGGPVTLSITSTSHSYPGLLLGYAKALPGGDVIIDSIDVTTPKSNRTGIEIYVFGQNMHLVDSVEAVADAPDRLSLLYPGPPFAVTCTIVSKTTTHLLLYVDIAKGVTPNKFTFNFYDAFLVLLATAPAAIHVMPSDNAAVISDADRANLDAAIPTAGGASWGPVNIPVSKHAFGDNIVGVGFTVTSATYGAGVWTVSGTNAAAGAQWELRIMQPASGEVTVYRFPGGVTT